MTAKNRIDLIRLADRINHSAEYSKRIGVEVTFTKKDTSLNTAPRISPDGK